MKRLTAPVSEFKKKLVYVLYILSPVFCEVQYVLMVEPSLGPRDKSTPLKTGNS